MVQIEVFIVLILINRVVLIGDQKYCGEIKKHVYGDELSLCLSISTSDALFGQYG